MHEKYLAEVIFKISFEPVLELYTNEKHTAAKFQNIITHEFPDLQFEENKKIIIESNLVERKEFSTWIFSNDSGKKVSLNGKELVLNYTGELYSSFIEFSKDIELILTALKQYNLAKVKSIGLKYINQMKLEDDKYNLGQNNELIQSITKSDFKIQDYDLTIQIGQFNPKSTNDSSKKEFIYDCRLNNDKSFEKIMINLEKMYEIISNSFKQELHDETLTWKKYLNKQPITPKKCSVKDFRIDTSHYKSNGLRVIKTIDIEF